MTAPPAHACRSWRSPRSRLSLLIPVILLAGLAVVFQSAASTAGASSNSYQVIPADYAGVNYVGAGLPAVAGKTIRLWDDGTNWCDLEPQPGVWNTGALETLVTNLRSAGYTQIILTLGMTPAWASTGAQGQGPNYVCSGQSAYTTTVPTEDAWYGYVAHLASEFAGRITAYEAWNEPASQTYWTGTYQQMSRLTSLAYWAVKQFDPAATVLSGSLTPRSTPGWDYNYLQQIAWDGWQIDGIAFHSYSYFRCVPDAGTGQCAAGEVKTMLDDHVAQVNAVNSGIAQMQPPRAISVWETEVNHNDAGTVWATVSQGAQVQLVARTFIDDIRYGVNHEVWYAFNRAFGVSMDNTGAAYLTLRTMQSWVTGHVFINCYDHTVSGVEVVQCYVDGREIDWSAKSVQIPGLNGLRCTLPDGVCASATNITLTPTPQLIVYQ
ncbi:MAG: hypothetical protein ACR2KJ_18955 [Jatrophihabitans sp.]